MGKRPVVFVVPGRIDTRTGGYIYDRRMIDGLRESGRAVELREIDGSFPWPTEDVLEEAGATLAAIPDGTTVVIDGLAFGAMPDVVAVQSTRLRLVALLHLPLAADVTLDPEIAAGVRSLERRALAHASLVIVTGSATPRLLASYGVDPGRIAVVEPGTDRVSVARGSRGHVTHLLCVATVGRGKGHEILLRALARVPGEWRLTCAGSLTRDLATAGRVREVLRELHLERRVELLGDLGTTELRGQYEDADLFVLATLQETYGMAVAEALAHGLAVVSTATGAIPELVGDAAGLVVPPNDVEALAAALGRVIADAGLRAALAAGARRARERLPTWKTAAANMIAALERCDHHG